MTAIAKLSHRALIRVTGPDWATFLKGLCTAHIDRISQEIAEGRFHSLHYGAFLRPQGKMYADALLQAVAPEEIWLDVPVPARDELLAKLTLYRLRAKVTIEAMDGPVYVAFGGDLPSGFLADPRGRVTGATFGFSYENQGDEGDAGDWVAFRMNVGLSDPGYDFGMDALYAIDANLDLLDAIDFHKGCYVGQELTSRMKRRGQIKNRILPFRYTDDLPESGHEILQNDRKAGEVLLAGRGIGLGLMRLDRLEGMTGKFDDGIVPFVPLWMAPHAVVVTPDL